jgi:hypothetical protein
MQLLTYPRQTDCIGGFPSAESLRTSCTSSQKDYVQPTKFVLRTDGFMPQGNPSQYNPLRIVMVQSTSQTLEAPAIA